MSKNLEIAIGEAQYHYHEYGRSTIIFVPKSLRTQAYSIFNKGNAGKKWSFQAGYGPITLAVGEICGQGMPHYETVYIINPHEMEDRVLNELKMVPDNSKEHKAMVICIKI